MADALPFLRDVARDDPAGSWGAYLLILRDTAEAVGSAGFSGGPNADGVVVLGYSVYPAFQRRGLAAEAAAALVTWALTRPGVRRVEATIPADHIASRRVAAKAGLRRTERIEVDEDVGPVEVWECLPP